MKKGQAVSAPQKTALHSELPRLQVGGNSQRMLAAVMFDYAFPSPDGVTSDVIISILDDFEISPSAARSALTRVVSRGLLQSTRAGKQLRYQLSERSIDIHDERLAFCLDFGHHIAPWDEEWSVVLFSIPEQQRGLRPLFRSTLKRLDYWPLTDGVWISTSNNLEQLEAEANTIGVKSAHMRSRFSSTHEALTIKPLDAYPLESMRQIYQDFIAHFAPFAARARYTDLSDKEALLVRTQVIEAWNHIARTVPDVPPHLLDAQWPQNIARTLFLELREILAAQSLQRMRHLVTHAASDHSTVVEHYA